MQKATYTKLANELAGGKGFVRKSQSDLQAKILAYTERSLIEYRSTRDVVHVQNATIALTQYNVKLLRAYHKACKDLLAIHNAFELKVTTNTPEVFEYTFGFGKIGKDMRPRHLPSLERVTREMKEAWIALSKPKPGRSDEQKKASEIKRTTTSMFAFEEQDEAIDYMGLEDLRVIEHSFLKLAAKAASIIARKTLKSVPKTTKPKRTAVKKKKVTAKKKPATTSVGKAIEKAAEKVAA